MSAMNPATILLEQEARALLTRLNQLRPFAVSETMIPAAALAPDAQWGIERFLMGGRAALRGRVLDYLDWLRGPGRAESPAEQQRRFVVIRLQFNNVLSQLDLFAEVVTQRSEHDSGVWLSGLDVLAADALQARGFDVTAPPVVCYLARGPGAAIRRARTRLPGGASNPVSIIRVPRERMIGHGIASSLIHEVGHQIAALFDVVPSVQTMLLHRYPAGSPSRHFGLWASEILADLWSVGKLGIGSTLGLMAVVSLPQVFVFRPSGNDPHPPPAVRVLISCAMGNALYPHHQWRSLASTWSALYPPQSLPSDHRRWFDDIAAGIPDFVAALMNHRPTSMAGRSLGEVVRDPQRTPDRLLATFGSWGTHTARAAATAPSLAFAAVGQARTARRITPEAESRLLRSLLRDWALRSSLSVAASNTTTTVSRIRIPTPATAPSRSSVLTA